MKVLQRLGVGGLSSQRKSGKDLLPVPGRKIPTRRLPAEFGLPGTAHRTPEPAILSILYPIFQQEPGLGFNVAREFEIQVFVRRPEVPYVAKVTAFPLAVSVTWYSEPRVPAPFYGKDIRGKIKTGMPNT